MGSSIAPKMFPSAGGFGKSQTNIASQVQTPDVANNPQQAQSQALTGQGLSDQAIAAQGLPAIASQNPNAGGGGGLNDENSPILVRLRNRMMQDKPGPMPFYG